MSMEADVVYSTDKLERIERALQLIARLLIESPAYRGDMSWPEANELRQFMLEKSETTLAK